VRSSGRESSSRDRVGRRRRGLRRLDIRRRVPATPCWSPPRRAGGRGHHTDARGSLARYLTRGSIRGARLDPPSLGEPPAPDPARRGTLFLLGDLVGGQHRELRCVEGWPGMRPPGWWPLATASAAAAARAASQQQLAPAPARTAVPACPTYPVRRAAVWPGTAAPTRAGSRRWTGNMPRHRPGRAARRGHHPSTGLCSSLTRHWRRGRAWGCSSQCPYHAARDDR
jgi:hypothetical protein